MQKQFVEYQDNSVTLEGYLTFKNADQKKPAILVAHDWSGRNEFACKKAEQLAELGYVGFALDMFGKGKFGKEREEKVQLIAPFMENRGLLLQRITAALNIVKQQDMIDKTHIGAIGFCFGGLCVLDLARSGADIAGVVSFHGLLNAPEDLPNKKITAKILALHGYDDPMVTPEVVAKFQKELTSAKVDWQMDIYGNTMHAFTNPLANDPDFGTVYNKTAERRSWIAMKEFFVETFGK